ncbi:hypothetical protein ACHAWF_012142 [Thalassiosira exigua]
MTKKSKPVAVPVANAVLGLGEPLLATESRPYLEVMAPATLSEGYAFEAEVDRCSFMVKVPKGGVKKGQKFTVPYPSDKPATQAPSLDGRWRDGLCDCCQFGCCHSVLWNAWCCPLILVGQTMTRLKLNWLGCEKSEQSSSTFRILVGITIGYWIRLVSSDIVVATTPSTDTFIASGLHNVMVGVVILVDLAFIVLLISLVYKTRRHIRDKYRIPQTRCKGCEDCCCAFWCTCCTNAQMARQTADYDTYAAKCCSTTGLSPNVSLEKCANVYSGSTQRPDILGVLEGI